MTQGLTQVAWPFSLKYKIPFDLLCAVIEQESGWDPWAIRFEHGFLSHYVAPLLIKGEINETEAYARSMSWGLMQVMGQVAREFGFKGDSLAELCDPQVGLEWGCRKLADCMTRAVGDQTKALLIWNGGGDPNYASQVLARRVRYSQNGQEDVILSTQPNQKGE